MFDFDISYAKSIKIEQYKKHDMAEISWRLLPHGIGHNGTNKFIICPNGNLLKCQPQGCCLIVETEVVTLALSFLYNASALLWRLRFL